MIQRRYSRQRELIYHCVRNTTEHPTADMVYRWLLPDNPNLSRGTVYRNLKLLAEEGKLKLLHFPVERYDAQTMEHPHFYCTQCGLRVRPGLADTTGSWTSGGSRSAG